ncbi:hypothetical protein GN156_12180 [bacterium LRH843]|nr:hypothetical protein [bacterium LRH843]
MKRPGRIFGGMLLVLIGVSILLGMFGIHLGSIIGLAIGAWLLYWGYSKWQQKGRWSFSSILLMMIGGLIVLGGLGGIMSLLAGIVLIYAGYKLLKPKSELDEVELDDTPVKSTYDTIDEEFEKLMKEKSFKY